MSIDTQEQALAEARKRWGKRAYAHDYFNWKTVGYYKGTLNSHHSSGKTWDAAFADADKSDRKQDV